jgi:hypothetical protein
VRISAPASGFVDALARFPLRQNNLVHPPTKAKCLKGTLLMKQWIVAVLFSMVSASAWAQQDQALRGIASVNLVIEELDEDAKTCGVTESVLDTSVRFVLSQSRIKINSSASSYIYINVNVMSLTSSDSCVYNYSVSFNSSVKVVANNVFAIAETWSKGGISVYRRSETPRRVAENIERVTKSLVVEWSKAN